MSQATAESDARPPPSASAKYSPVFHISARVPAANDIAIPAKPSTMNAPAAMDARPSIRRRRQLGFVSAISRRRIKLGRMRRIPNSGGRVNSSVASTAIPMPCAAVKKSQAGRRKKLEIAREKLRERALHDESERDAEQAAGESERNVWST